MKCDRNAPRYRGGHVNLKEGTGAITKLCPTGDFMEVYKVDRTFRVYPPECLDPHETDPDMPWMSKASADVGSGNRIVARVFIQSAEALRKVAYKTAIDVDDICRAMHKCKEYLLVAESKSNGISHDEQKIMQSINKGNVRKQGSHYSNFPQVEQLEEGCASFLTNTKRFVQTLVEVVNIFYGTSFNGPRFDKIVTWAEKHLKYNPEFIDYMKKNVPALKHIVELRNAQEHPKESCMLVINNFTPKAGGDIMPPVWYLTGETPALLAPDMTAIIDILIRISEGILFHCIMDNIDTAFPFYVHSIKSDQRDIDCPIKHSIEIDLSQLSMNINKNQK